MKTSAPAAIAAVNHGAAPRVAIPRAPIASQAPNKIPSPRVALRLMYCRIVCSAMNSDPNESVVAVQVLDNAALERERVNLIKPADRASETASRVPRPGSAVTL